MGRKTPVDALVPYLKAYAKALGTRVDWESVKLARKYCRQRVEQPAQAHIQQQDMETTKTPYPL
jgi:hypothetical protein